MCYSIIFCCYLGFYRLIVFKQVNSCKELDDKMVAIVHLDQKGLKEHRDLLGEMEQRVKGETQGHMGSGVIKES